MLQMIREFTAEKLKESGEIEEIRRTHAEFSRAIAEEAQKHLQRETEKRWLDRLEMELGNIRAALQGCQKSHPVLTPQACVSTFRLLLAGAVRHRSPAGRQRRRSRGRNTELVNLTQRRGRCG